MTAPTVKPAIDYTDKDFESLRNAMLDLAVYRLPEWTDRSPGDVGMLLVDLFAYMGDVISYYQDRIASESFLDTAVERRSVMSLLRLIGYELAPPAAASAELTLTFRPASAGQPNTVTIPRWARFASTPGDSLPAQEFVYLGTDRQVSIVAPAGGGAPVLAGLPVRHGTLVKEELVGSSTGEPNQTFKLGRSPVILETLVVEVNEGGAGYVTWDRRGNLLYHAEPGGAIVTSRPDARDYYVQFDENGAASVVFGDGQYGHPPGPGTNNIRATYISGGGSAGNMPAGAIVDAKTQIAGLASVTNPLPASGGSDAEPTERAVRFGPLAFRAGDRAVTLNDYVTIAMQAGGIAKVRARTTGWNRVYLHVVPEGNAVTPPTDDLKKRIVDYFETRRMVGTAVYVEGAQSVPVDVAVDIIVEHNFQARVVQDQVRGAIAGLLAFSAVDFGWTLYLSKVYEAVEAVDGVRAATVTLFRRGAQAAGTPAAGITRAALLAAGLGEGLSSLAERAVSGDIAPEGRIDIGEIEIPKPGTITVTVVNATS
jgi:hypothetical protein